MQAAAPLQRSALRWINRVQHHWNELKLPPTKQRTTITHVSTKVKKTIISKTKDLPFKKWNGNFAQVVFIGWFNQIRRDRNHLIKWEGLLRKLSISGRSPQWVNNHKWHNGSPLWDLYRPLQQWQRYQLQCQHDF